MVKIEVEHRGPLTPKKFKELIKFFKKKGKSLGKKNRFSIIYWVRGRKIFKLDRTPIDLKLRITNKKTELVLKSGKWSGNDARKEFLFPIDSKKFEEITEFLKILGFYYGVLQATKTDCYLYKGIEFALVRVPSWGYYFEAEIVVSQNQIKSANKKIKLACRELGLNLFDDKGFCKLLEELNERPGFKFNLKKQKFSDIRKIFRNYF